MSLRLKYCYYQGGEGVFARDYIANEQQSWGLHGTVLNAWYVARAHVPSLGTFIISLVTPTTSGGR